MLLRKDHQEVIPQQIRNFVVLRKIGDGGMATVYLVRNLTDSKLYAMKVLHQSLLAKKRVHHRFFQEANTQMRLHHPNIIKCYDLNVESDHYYLVMEYIPGPSLHSIISKSTGPIPSNYAVPWFCQILSAINYAHHEGVIHRDIKPSNILVIGFNQHLSGGEILKAGDFGIAKIIGRDGRTEAGAKLGTPYYMSPEQVRDSRDVDMRSDIYSLGIIFFQMLSGRLPFRITSNEFNVMTQIINDPIPDPRTFYPDIPEHLIRVINKATHKKAAYRYSGCQEFAEALSFKDI